MYYNRETCTFLSIHFFTLSFSLILLLYLALKCMSPFIILPILNGTYNFTKISKGHTILKKYLDLSVFIYFCKTFPDKKPRNNVYKLTLTQLVHFLVFISKIQEIVNWSPKHIFFHSLFKNTLCAFLLHIM